MPRIDEEKLNKLHALLKVVNESLTKEEFLKAFENILKQIAGLEKQLIEKIEIKTKSAYDVLENLEKSYTKVIEKIKEDNTENLSSIRKWALQQITNFFLKNKINEQLTTILEEHTKKMEVVDKRMNEIRNGRDGKDANTEEIVAEVLKKIPQTKEEIPPEIQNKLESLETEWKKLQSEIEKIKNKFSNIPRGKAMGRVKVPIMRPVNLSSQLNGAARSFTLPPDTVQVIGIWGSQFPFTGVAGNSDFTLSGNTLTLDNTFAAPEAGQTLWVLVEALFYP